MPRPGQPGEPAEIDLGPVQRAVPAEAPAPASLGAASLGAAEMNAPAPARPGTVWPGPAPRQQDYLTDAYPLAPEDDTPVAGAGPHIPPPPWLARELDLPEPVTPAVPFFDPDPDDFHQPPPPPSPRHVGDTRRLVLVGAGLLALFLVAVLAGAGVVDALRTTSAGNASDDPAAGPTAAPGGATDTSPATERLVSGPLGNVREAEFDLVSGTTTVSIRTADLGGELYRISTPIDGDVLPRVIADNGQIALHLVPSGQTGPGVVDIELHSAVRWRLRLTGGVAQHTIDLRDANLAGLDIVGGAARIDLTLPPPDGTLPVRMSGGANQFLIEAPPGPPAQVRFGAGAASAIIDGDDTDGIAPGSVFTGNGWNSAADRYDIDAIAGVSVLSLQRN
ncbi:hypothetical protein ACN27F_05245 [Solwaraspora sp. WMMB335]|uniref:hypothetical protein n=1 Tax=Solwaraspora sp. WMMB335 TaxID=3404118 RepID=UPI003B93FFC6